jgi:uncharacterized membrane protein YecN with MAPEG domain
METNLGQSDEQQQKEDLFPSGSNLALRDITLVADDLVLDAAPPPPQLYSKSTPKQNSYIVELFWDEALVTATELLYGQTTYPLEDIDSLQILKLHRKRSVIQKKLSNFLDIMIATVGLILLFGPVAWSAHLLGLMLAVGSISCAIYFNWWPEQRRRGEFGLLMTMKLNSKVVITSHSLKAIQALYQIMFRRLDMADPNGESLMVNMYTGETISNY